MRARSQEEWLAAAEERRLHLEASGLPECDWLHELRTRPLPTELEEREELARSVDAHVASCQVCQARERYADERLGPLPDFPLPWWMSLFDSIHPRFRPAAVGAVMVGAMVLVRALFQPAIVARAFAAFLVTLVAAMAAGASGGLVYSLVRPPLMKYGRAGDYITGVLCVLAYVFGMLLIAPIAFGDALVESSLELLIFIALAIPFGLLVGHTIIRPLGR